MSSAITAAVVVAGASAYSANKQSKAAKSAAALAAESSDAALQFQIEQYDDWKSIYGDTQTTLSNYYDTLSPESYTAMGIQNIETEYNQSKQNLERALAQKGITQSGITGAALTSLEASRATASANVRTMAPQQVAAAQQDFLAGGQGLQSNLQQGITNTLGNQASMYANQANSYTQQAAQSYAGIGSALGSGISSYMTYKQVQQQPVQQPYTSPTINAMLGEW